jgi:hypothetical protein
VHAMRFASEVCCADTNAGFDQLTQSGRLGIMSTIILTAGQYEHLVVDGLQRIGLSPDQAIATAKLRWPMSASDAISECQGRGLSLEIQDLTAFLRHKFGTDHFDDGEALTASSVGWIPRTVEELLRWAVANRRGQPADDADPIMIPVMSVDAMMVGLRSDNIVVRLRSGFTLARAVGVGLRLQGEDPLDVEFIVGPDISKLIGRAIAGEAEAVEELERHVTVENPARQRSLEAN